MSCRTATRWGFPSLGAKGDAGRKGRSLTRLPSTGEPWAVDMHSSRHFALRPDHRNQVTPLLPSAGLSSQPVNVFT